MKYFAANVMEDYCFSSSDEEFSSSAPSASKDDKDLNPGLSQNSNSNCSSNNSRMQQSILEQPTLYRCPFCCFQAIIDKAMQDHLVLHFSKSAHQCQLCSFSIGTAPELYLHTQQHHLTEDICHSKVF